jgi:periplasmic mercuric ion binding protein
MKKFMFLTNLTILLFMGSQIFGLGSAILAQTADQVAVKNEPQTVKIKVVGMTCAGCANTISGALEKMEGVLEEQVLYPGDMATVKYDPEKTTEKEILKAIDDKGFKASVVIEEVEKKAPDN